MSARGWHILRNGAVVTLARHLPPRFDIAAETRFPAGLRPAVLAHELRKDLWRLLQKIKGFSPVIRVVEDDAGLVVRAGGAILGGGPIAAGSTDRIASLLDTPVLRARWIAHARRWP
ncbi:MAG: hypothetical protein AAGH83_05735 [Pseudomonadota bacterium]